MVLAVGVLELYGPADARVVDLVDLVDECRREWGGCCRGRCRCCGGRGFQLSSLCGARPSLVGANEEVDVVHVEDQVVLVPLRQVPDTHLIGQVLSWVSLGEYPASLDHRGVDPSGRRGRPALRYERDVRFRWNHSEWLQYIDTKLRFYT